MKKYDQVEFDRSLLAGLFAGIAATCIALIFNGYFRGSTGFSLSLIVNVSTIIFALTILLTIAGVIFYYFHHNFKRGTLLFQAISLVLTAALLYGVHYVNRSADPVQIKEFRELIFGVILITGLCTVFMLPFFFKTKYI